MWLCGYINMYVWIYCPEEGRNWLAVKSYTAQKDQIDAHLFEEGLSYFTYAKLHIHIYIRI